jgi:hypothetical protein
VIREERHLVGKGEDVVKWTRGEWVVRTSHAERVAFQAAVARVGSDGRRQWALENGMDWYWPRGGNDAPLERWTDGQDQRRRVLWGQVSVSSRAGSRALDRGT